MPTQESVVPIHNQLARPVLVYDHNSKTSHSVEADEVSIIAGCGAEKILWMFMLLPLVPGRYLWRRLAQTSCVEWLCL